MAHFGELFELGFRQLLPDDHYRALAGAFVRCYDFFRQFVLLPAALQTQWVLAIVLGFSFMLLVTFRNVPGVKFVLKAVVNLILYLTMLLRFGLGALLLAYVTYLTQYGNLRRALVFLILPLIVESFVFIWVYGDDGWAIWLLRRLSSIPR